MNPDVDSAAPVMDLRHVYKRYRMGTVDFEALRDIDLVIHPGDLVSIVGQSGCGKSTLMHILGLLDVPSEGTYCFEGTDVAAMDDDQLSAIRNQRIGFVFQQFFLLPRLTALENTGIPLLYGGVAKRERLRRSSELLAQVGMEGRAKHKPSELSGGQQQRIAIARALSMRPAVILADEPTGALDSEVSEQIMTLFTELNRQQGITIVIITHDPGVAARCDRRIHMRDGAIREESD